MIHPETRGKPPSTWPIVSCKIPGRRLRKILMRRRGNFHLVVSEPCHADATREGRRRGGAGQKTATPSLPLRSEMGQRSQKTSPRDTPQARINGGPRFFTEHNSSSSLHQLRIWKHKLSLYFIVHTTYPECKKKEGEQEGSVCLTTASAPPTTRQTSSPMESCLRPGDRLQAEVAR